MADELLHRIERYYDAVPRRFAQVEECGPFTLFLGEPGGWVFYARPRLGGGGDFASEDVAAAIRRLRELDLPPSVEWVHEMAPGLLAAVQAEGSLAVEEIPLLALDGDLTVDTPVLPAGVVVRPLGPDDASGFAAARAVADVAFAASGTARGPGGPAERDAAAKPDAASVPRVLGLIAEGAVVVEVAEHPEHGILATGRIQPIGDITEVLGVATLPFARRQGLGAAVTAALVADARRRGLRTVFLTAASEDVARVYAGLGFRRVATGYAAEPAR